MPVKILTEIYFIGYTMLQLHPSTALQIQAQRHKKLPLQADQVSSLNTNIFDRK